jgi:hypothetical protein
LRQSRIKWILPEDPLAENQVTLLKLLLQTASGTNFKIAATTGVDPSALSRMASLRYPASRNVLQRLGLLFNVDPRLLLTEIPRTAVPPALAALARGMT